jgi:hypothetical protein
VLNYKDGSTVVLKPVLSGSEENEEFYKYTPSGEINLGLVIPEVAKFFIPGGEYYIDIKEAK